MASLNPAQTVGAGKGPGKYPYEVTKSILGSEGKTLLECIQGGIVEKPTAISWNSWQQWRRTTSPKEETDGFRQESTIERRLHLETMVALYGTQWESESKPTESGVSAILSEPLCGQGRTSSPLSGGLTPVPDDDDNPMGEATATQGGTPTKSGTSGDILQEKDPWLGQQLPGTRPSTPIQMGPSTMGRPTLGAADAASSSGSKPSIPPGLGEPRKREDYFGEGVPIPASPATPRGRPITVDEEVKLQSPQPMRASSNLDTPEQSAKSEASTFSTDDPEVILLLCYANYKVSEGTVDEHIRRMMKNSERLRAMGRPLTRKELGMLTMRAYYEKELSDEAYEIERDEYTGTPTRLPEALAMNRRRSWLEQEYLAQKAGMTSESDEQEEAKLQALSTLLVMYGVRVEDLIRQPTPPPIFQVSGLEFKSQRPASGMSGNTWNSAGGGSRPQSRANMGPSGSSTPSFAPQQPRVPTPETWQDNTADGRRGESVEETVRRMLAEAARATSRNSSLDDKLEKLAEIVEANVEDTAKRRERTGAQRSILDLKPRWSFPEVHGRAGDDYEKFFKEFEETMRIMETNNPGGISDRETWMVLGKQVHGTVSSAFY